MESFEVNERQPPAMQVYDMIGIYGIQADALLPMPLARYRKPESVGLSPKNSALRLNLSAQNL